LKHQATNQHGHSGEQNRSSEPVVEVTGRADRRAADRDEDGRVQSGPLHIPEIRPGGRQFGPSLGKLGTGFVQSLLKLLDVGQKLAAFAVERLDVLVVALSTWSIGAGTPSVFVVTT
jgi:hypothetical protein